MLSNCVESQDSYSWQPLHQRQVSCDDSPGSVPLLPCRQVYSVLVSLMLSRCNTIQTAAQSFHVFTWPVVWYILENTWAVTCYYIKWGLCNCAPAWSSGWPVHQLQGRAVPDVDHLGVTLLEQNTNQSIASVFLSSLVFFIISVHSHQFCL